MIGTLCGMGNNKGLPCWNCAIKGVEYCVVHRPKEELVSKLIEARVVKMEEKLSRMSKRMAKLRRQVAQEKSNRNHYLRNRGKLAEERSEHKLKAYAEARRAIKRFKHMKFNGQTRNGKHRVIFMVDENEARKLRKMLEIDLRQLNGRKTLP